MGEMQILLLLIVLAIYFSKTENSWLQLEDVIFDFIF